MSAKSKFLLTLILALLGGLVVIATWLVTGHDWVAYLLFVWLLVGTWMLYRVACPQCGTPVAYSAKFGKLRILSAIPRRTCEQCGYDLTTHS